MPFVTVGARSDVGRVRELNEDSIYVGTHVWAVADGMGGHAAGDVASTLATQALRSMDHEGLAVEELLAAISTANEAISKFGEQNPDSMGLGTTLSGVAEVTIGAAHHWAVFNVGDSRVYRFSDGELARATIDHSEVEEMVLDGRITEDQARTHPARNYITRSLGSDPAPEVDIFVLPQSRQELFLICSDGLTTEVRDESIAATLSQRDPQVAADELVRFACAEGGHDNVSAVVLLVARPTDDVADERTHPREKLSRDGNGA